MFHKKSIVFAIIYVAVLKSFEGKPKLREYLLFSSSVFDFISSKHHDFSASFIKVCRRSDPHLNDCIKNSVEHLRPLLAKGIPEFDIPSCEPLCIPEVVIDQGSGAVAVRSTYRNVKVYGPSKFILRHVK
jgi:hypothetical protein